MSSSGRPRSGAVLVTDAEERLLGIFTNGDLRRHVLVEPGLMEATIESVMTADPKRSRKDHLLADAFKVLKEHQIDELPVVDDADRLVGLLDVQDVLEWGVAL